MGFIILPAARINVILGVIMNEMMKNKLWIYLGFFAVLLTVFYLFVFSDYNFSASKLGVINPQVPEFKFSNQDGKIITQAQTDNKVYVAEYFFTTCKGICPKMNA